MPYEINIYQRMTQGAENENKQRVFPHFFLAVTFACIVFTLIVKIYCLNNLKR